MVIGRPTKINLIPRKLLHSTQKSLTAGYRRGLIGTSQSNDPNFVDDRPPSFEDGFLLTWGRVIGYQCFLLRLQPISNLAFLLCPHRR